MEYGTIGGLMGWQRAHVLSAAQYVRELMTKSPDDLHTRAVYVGLLEVLEPARRTLRQLREHRLTTKGGSMWDRRAGYERRLAPRRTVDLAPPDGVDRRRAERRCGADRRKP